MKAIWGANELQMTGQYENGERIATFSKKSLKKFENFNKILKNFWKFSKSKKWKILKSIFRPKNCFPLPWADIRSIFIVFESKIKN